ncbi:hypothetical protein [Pseudomonas yamanorum]
MRRIFICGMVLLIATIGGCGCGPFSEQLETQFKWQPQTLQAQLSSPDAAREECSTVGYRQCVKATALLCKDEKYLSIKHPVTGDPVDANLAKAVCSEVEVEISRNDPRDTGVIWLCRSQVPGQIRACMKEKGFVGINVEKRTCYMKIM